MTTKSVGLVAVPPSVSTVTGPVAASEGTTTVNPVRVAWVTEPNVVPPPAARERVKRTQFRSVPRPPKRAPLIVTVSPARACGIDGDDDGRQQDATQHLIAGVGHDDGARVGDRESARRKETRHVSGSVREATDSGACQSGNCLIRSVCGQVRINGADQGINTVGNNDFAGAINRDAGGFGEASLAGRAILESTLSTGNCDDCAATSSRQYVVPSVREVNVNVLSLDGDAYQAIEARAGEPLLPTEPSPASVLTVHRW